MMTMIENVKQPLVKCPECEGKGVVFYDETYDASTNYYSRDDAECGACKGEGEVTLWVADEWADWS